MSSSSRQSSSTLEVITLRRAGASLGLLLAGILSATASHAAGTAYAVDTAEVGEVGACKVETWGSWAANRDRVFTTSPACVVSAMPRVEFSTELTRTRTDDEWFSIASPKVKMNLIPTAIGSPGLAIVAGSVHDLSRGDTTNLFAYMPATLRLSETMRINVSGGWLQDRTADRHFATYGASLDWLFAPKFSMKVETFGQFNGQSLGSETQARFQAGIRYRPVDQFSTDLIYGRNINGENSDWITLSTTIRFNL